MRSSSWLRKHQLLLISFGATFAISLIIFALLKMAPFGPDSILANDSAVQYVDFYTYLRHVLSGQAGATYSFSNALGGGMFANWTYYLLSPFNVIFAIVPRSALPAAVLFVTALKYSFAALTAQWFAQSRVGDQAYTLIFSLGYGLSGFVIANFLNLMWLDGIILLPLVIWGLERLVNQQQIWGFVFSLTGAYITNYYIGFMITLFSFLYLMWSLLGAHHEHPIQALVRYIAAGLTSALLSAFILIPTFMSLTGSRLSSADPDFHLKALYPLVQVLNKFIPGSFNFDQLSDGLPNIFVGTTALTFVLLYFVAPKVPIRKKLVSLLISLILLLSIWINPLVLVWQGMRAPVWYLYRHSFVIIFWLLLLGLDAMRQLPTFKRRHLLLPASGMILILITTWLAQKHAQYLTTTGLIVFAVTIGVTLALLATDQVKPSYRPITTSLLVLVTAAELFANGFLSLSAISYVPKADFTVTSALLDQAYAKAKTGQGFGRLTSNVQRSMDDPYQYNFNGLSTFSSVLETKTIDTLSAIGLNGSAGRVKNNDTFWPLESLLGVKSVLWLKGETSEQFAPSYQQLSSREISNTRYDLATYRRMSLTPYFDLYRNPDALPLATQIYHQIPAATQPNPLLQVAAYYATFSQGAMPALFTAINFNNMTTDNLKPLTTLSNATATKQNSKKNASLTLTVDPSLTQRYLVLGETMRGNLTITINNKTIANDPDYGSKVLSLPADGVTPTTVTLTFNHKVDQTILDHFVLYQMDRTTFEALTARAKQMAPSQQIKNDQIKLHTKAQNSGTLMLTIPYNQGWQSDDPQVKPFNYRGLLGVHVPKAARHFTLTYHTPGLKLGALISGTTGLLIVLFALGRWWICRCHHV